MGMVPSSFVSTQGLKTDLVRIKTLKVVGEAIGQLVLQHSICINAVKIDRISAKLQAAEDHLFNNKVVKQGIIHIEIFYVNPTGVLRYLAHDVPFMLTVDIPGFVPNAFTEVQNHLLDIDIDYILTPARVCIPGCLKMVIAAHILVKACEWTQLDVVTRVNLYPRIQVGHC